MVHLVLVRHLELLLLVHHGVALVPADHRVVLDGEPGPAHQLVHRADLRHLGVGGRVGGGLLVREVHGVDGRVLGDELQEGVDDGRARRRVRLVVHPVEGRGVMRVRVLGAEGVGRGPVPVAVAGRAGGHLGDDRVVVGRGRAVPAAVNFLVSWFIGYSYSFIKLIGGERGSHLRLSGSVRSSGSSPPQMELPASEAAVLWPRGISSRMSPRRGPVGLARARSSAALTLTPALARSREARSGSKGLGMGRTGRSLVLMPRCCRDMCECRELRDLATVPQRTHR